MRERTVAIMGLKGEERWEGPKVQLCTGFDGAKYGLEQPFEAIAVRGLPPITVPWVCNAEDAEAAGKGDFVPSLRLGLAARQSSKDGFFFYLDLLVRFLCSFSVWDCEGRGCWAASLGTFTLLCIPFSFLML